MALADLPGYPGIPGGRKRLPDVSPSRRGRLAWRIAYLLVGGGFIALVVWASLSADQARRRARPASPATLSLIPTVTVGI